MIPLPLTCCGICSGQGHHSHHSHLYPVTAEGELRATSVPWGQEKGSLSSSHVPRWAWSWARTHVNLSKLPLDFGHITIIPAQVRPSRHTQLLLCTCFLAAIGSSHLLLRRITSSRLSSATGVGVNRTCEPCFWGFSSNSTVTHGSLIPLALLAQYGFETYFQVWNLENTPWTRSCKPVNPLLAPIPFPGNISPYGATVPMCITASHLPRKHHLAPSAALQWIIIYIITYLCIYFPRWPLLMVCCT